MNHKPLEEIVVDKYDDHSSIKEKLHFKSILIKNNGKSQ